MSVAILAGFVTGKGAIHAPSLEERFVGSGMDADAAHELHEQSRCGCPLCVTSDPWAEVRQGESVRLDCLEGENNPRHDDGVIGEGLVAASQQDFRDALDEPGIEFEVRDGEIVACNCSEEDVQNLQGIGCSAVVALGQGLYELFFPAALHDELVAVVG